MEFDPPDGSFIQRHIGPHASQIAWMCKELGIDDPEEIAKQTVPEDIYDPHWTAKTASLWSRSLSEHEALTTLQSYFADDQIYRQFYGMGYYPARTPEALKRYLFENPGWYTPYTPYQAEVSQGRLEMLFLFQTLCCELTGLPLACASLLDEGTAAAEAMSLSFARRKNRSARRYLVSRHLFPQTLAVLISRANSLGIVIELWEMSSYKSGDLHKMFESGEWFGVLLGYPDGSGQIYPLEEMCSEIRLHQGVVACCTDLLALMILPPPGELGVDIACGSAQRLGVPLGYGGPHAAFFACSIDYLRQLPGRVVGRSKDRSGAMSYRLALQTREQHIKREKATSNICTAQALLASMAAAYAVYHGKTGLIAIAQRIHRLTVRASCHLRACGIDVKTDSFFDTLRFQFRSQEEFDDAQKRTHDSFINLIFDCHISDDDQLMLMGQFSLAEAHTIDDIRDLLWGLTGQRPSFQDDHVDLSVLQTRRDPQTFLCQEIFAHPPSELEFMRWLKRLENKDISLTQSMIPLGSCTMKLNAAAELAPLSWDQLAHAHPYQPTDQVKGYMRMIKDLKGCLAALTGLDEVSLQPNSGAQGELAGLMTIMRYHRYSGQSHRDVCFVPSSAHGTNPASAVMAGLKVVVIGCDSQGNIDLGDLKSQIQRHGSHLACFMVTYPSTHGVFESSIRYICKLIHETGGQVYLDGANLNAQLGVCVPGHYGIDVCHMNLHKTFCIPHGGGGPGAGPIAVATHLSPYLPVDPIELGSSGLCHEGESGFSISACHYGSPSILVISWMYIRMMSAVGLKKASEIAILNANYMAYKLDPYYPVLYKGRGGWVAHECLLDLREIQKCTSITVEDIAKRLMDFGFHAPTISFPIAGTLMIEPTESEDLEEMNRFIEAMVAIRTEIKAVESGQCELQNSPLRKAPHPWWLLTADWQESYSQQQACFPLPWLKDRKFWPATQRIDNAYGDRQFVCACDPMESYEN